MGPTVRRDPRARLCGGHCEGCALPSRHEKRRSSLPRRRLRLHLPRLPRPSAAQPQNRTGCRTNAVLGFCNMVWKLMQDARTPMLASRPAISRSFSTIRPKPSATSSTPTTRPTARRRRTTLIPQFGLIREATRAFSLPCIEHGGLRGRRHHRHLRPARPARRAPTPPSSSSDKDLMQLVRADACSMYDPMKDRQIGVPEVIEKWGVPPEKMIDLQAMMGDSVDNVPGIPGVGQKTAAQLHRTVRRPRHAARPRRRDQAGQAPANDHRQCRQGAHLARIWCR